MGYHPALPLELMDLLNALIVSATNSTEYSLSPDVHQELSWIKDILPVNNTVCPMPLSSL